VRFERTKLPVNCHYSYVKFSKWDFGAFRWLGPGLGNLLFPWARFVLASKQHDLRPIAPTWPAMKFGTLLRRELDARFYFGLFRAGPGQVVGWRKLWLLATARRVDETRLPELPQHGASQSGEHTLSVFEGIRDGFATLPRDATPLRNELLSITLAKHRGDLYYKPSKCISMHVRLGDFRNSHILTPLAWFLGVAKHLREQLKADWPIHIFSDGTDDELAPLLGLHNSQRVGYGSSAADLLAMSRANVLVASKLSTLNMWSFYLGRMPVIWPPDTDRFGLEKIDPELQFLQGGEERVSEAGISAVWTRKERLG
jgi:hypothetical protein